MEYRWYRFRYCDRYRDIACKSVKNSHTVIDQLDCRNSPTHSIIPNTQLNTEIMCRNMWKYPLKYAPEHTIQHWKTKKLHTVGGGTPHSHTLPPSVASLPRAWSLRSLAGGFQEIWNAPCGISGEWMGSNVLWWVSMSSGHHSWSDGPPFLWGGGGGRRLERGWERVEDGFVIVYALSILIDTLSKPCN